MATKPKKTRMPAEEFAIGGFALDGDDEAEAFGEEFLATATSGEFVGEDARNEDADEGIDYVEEPPTEEDGV